MKILNSRLIMFIALAMILISFYQLYWLVNYYSELREKLTEDIQEVLRSSDFEELAHRVDEISKMDFKGRLDVNMGYDHAEQKNITRSQVRQPDDEVTPEPTGTQTVVSAESFSEILKRPEDLINIGLNMQRGIHSSLDVIRDVNMTYLDSIISIKLDSIGVAAEHQLLYIKKRQYADASEADLHDTLYMFGDNMPLTTNSFTHQISEDAEYCMIIPEYNKAILVKMVPIILFSFFTLTLLIVTFIYLIRVMHKQKELEEIKTDFTNNITHELKTPIAVAYAANDALLNFNSEANTPRMNKYLTVCQEQLRQLDSLVEQILSISMDRNKPFLLNLEEINVGELVSSLVNTYKLKYSDRVIFHDEIDSSITLRSDRMHLFNIVSNLIDNAIKYSKGVADINIKAYIEDGASCVIEVSDKGIGITADQQKYIFDRFYRVPHGNVHDVKGYGLGLFYVKSMTEKLGGSVSVRSSLGSGSTFSLVFKTDNYE